MKFTTSLLSITLSLGMLSLSACGDSDDPGGDGAQGTESQGGQDPNPTGNTTDGTGSNDPDNDPDQPKIDCSSLKATGTQVGDIPPNVVLKDAKGQDVSLHEHCNSIVYIIAGTAG